MLSRLNNSFFKYLIVGTIGFIVDGGILSLLTKFGVSALAGRSASIAVALLVTWWIHRNFTFQVSAPPSVREVFKYLAANAVGAATNYGVYCAVLLFLFKNQPLVALAISSIVALAVNYFSAKFMVFKVSSGKTVS